MIIQQFNRIHFTLMGLSAVMAFIVGMLVEAALDSNSMHKARDLDIQKQLVNLHTYINEIDEISREKTIVQKRFQTLVYSLRLTDTELTGAIYGLTGYPRK